MVKNKVLILHFMKMDLSVLYCICQKIDFYFVTESDHLKEYRTKLIANLIVMGSVKSIFLKFCKKKLRAQFNF